MQALLSVKVEAAIFTKLASDQTLLSVMETTTGNQQG